MRVVAAIPVFNEGASLPGLIDRLAPLVDQVLVVDDGSTDGSAAIAADAGATVVGHEHNLGKGAGIQSAFVWAKSDPSVTELVLLDGDGQHDPSDVTRMVTDLRQRRLDIVIGSRFQGTNNAPLYRLFGLHVLTAAANLGSGTSVSDSQSGFRAFSRRAIESLDLRERSFAVESEMQFEAADKGLALGEVPIDIHYEGPARRSPVAHGFSVLLPTASLTLRRRPLRLPLIALAPLVAISVARGKHPAVSQE